MRHDPAACARSHPGVVVSTACWRNRSVPGGQRARDSTRACRLQALVRHRHSPGSVSAPARALPITRHRGASLDWRRAPQPGNALRAEIAVTKVMLPRLSQHPRTRLSGFKLRPELRCKATPQRLQIELGELPHALAATEARAREMVDRPPSSRRTHRSPPRPQATGRPCTVTFSPCRQMASRQSCRCPAPSRSRAHPSPRGGATVVSRPTPDEPPITTTGLLPPKPCRLL